MVRFMTLVAVVLACTAVAATVALKPYPGPGRREGIADRDDNAEVSREKKASMLKATVYMTADAYDSVTAYYLAKGRDPPAVNQA